MGLLGLAGKARFRSRPKQSSIFQKSPKAAHKVSHCLSFRVRETLQCLMERKCLNPLVAPDNGAVQKIGCRTENHPSAN
jgi:hypothetical protein